MAESKGVLDILKILKILLYPKSLQEEHAAELKKFQRGIVWLWRFARAHSPDSARQQVPAMLHKG